MKVSLNIDKTLKDIFISISAPKIDKNLSEVIERLEENKSNKITAYANSKIYLVDIKDIYYFYTEARKVYISTEKESFWVKHTLAEIENELVGNSFVRASKGVIINMNKVSNFEQMFNGNLVVNFENGKHEYVSRRYLTNIKEYLNI